MSDPRDQFTIGWTTCHDCGGEGCEYCEGLGEIRLMDSERVAEWFDGIYGPREAQLSD